MFSADVTARFRRRAASQALQSLLVKHLNSCNENEPELIVFRVNDRVDVAWPNSNIWQG